MNPMQVKNGQKGTSDFYQQSANPNVKSECDEYDHYAASGPSVPPPTPTRVWYYNVRVQCANSLRHGGDE